VSPTHQYPTFPGDGGPGGAGAPPEQSAVNLVSTNVAFITDGGIPEVGGGTTVDALDLDEPSALASALISVDVEVDCDARKGIASGVHRVRQCRALYVDRWVAPQGVSDAS
jgi:hypothetical protein